MKKYSLFTVLSFTVLLLLAVFGSGVSAASTGPWDISAAEDNSVTAEVVKNGESNTYTLKVKSTVKNGVIRDYATYQNPGWRDDYGDKITAIEIGTGIEKIGENAFYQLNQVSFMEVKANVKNIAKGAFYGLGAAVDDDFAVTFTGNIGTLAGSSFYNIGYNAGKIDILFKGNIDTVATDAFCNLGYDLGKNKASASDYKGHLNFTVEGDVGTLAYHSFYNAILNASHISAAVKFDFRGNVGLIGEEAFKNLLGNATDTAERCITLKFNFDGTVYGLEQSAFEHVGYELGENNTGGLCAVTMANCTVKTIPARCFNGFGSRTALDLTVPKLLAVDKEAFQYAGTEAFTLKLNGETNTVPAGVKYIGSAAFGWVGTPITVPSTLGVAVAEGAFDNYDHPAANWTTMDATPAFTPAADKDGETGVTVMAYRAADGSEAGLTCGEILGVAFDNDESLYENKDLYLLVKPNGSGNVSYLSAPYTACDAIWSDKNGYYTQDFSYFIADKDVASLTVAVYAKIVSGGVVTMKKAAEATVTLEAPDLKTALAHVYGGMFVGDTTTVGQLLEDIGIPYGKGLTVTALTVDSETVLAADSSFKLTAKAKGTAKVTFSGTLSAAYGGSTFTDAVLNVQVIEKPKVRSAANSVKITGAPTGEGWYESLDGIVLTPAEAEFTVLSLSPGNDYRIYFRKNLGTAAKPLFSVFALSVETVAGYNVQVKSVLYGSVESSVDAAAKGDTVTVTATPDKGYDLYTIEVKDVNGYDVPVYEMKFTMPGCGVTITPTFKEAKYTVAVEPSKNGTVTVSKLASLAGTTVKIILEPDEFYKIGKVEVKTEGGVIVPVSNNEFSMPAENVKVAAEFIRDTGVSRFLETVIHRNYLNGYEDNTLRPEGNLTRAEAAQLFYSLLKNKTATAKASFSDVTEDDWYYNQVSVMAGLGFIAGYEDGTFRGERLITRAEFTAIAVRFAYAMAGESDFPDVTADFWGKKYIDTAVAYGWISGYENGTFRPENNIKRCEAVTIINRMLERSADKNYILEYPDKIKVFSDLKVTEWYYYQMAEACNAHEYTKDEKGNETWQ